MLSGKQSDQEEKVIVLKKPTPQALQKLSREKRKLVLAILSEKKIENSKNELGAILSCSSEDILHPLKDILKLLDDVQRETFLIALGDETLKFLAHDMEDLCWIVASLPKGRHEKFSAILVINIDDFFQLEAVLKNVSQDKCGTLLERIGNHKIQSCITRAENLIQVLRLLAEPQREKLLTLFDNNRIASTIDDAHQLMDLLSFLSKDRGDALISFMSDEQLLSSICHAYQFDTNKILERLPIARRIALHPAFQQKAISVENGYLTSLWKRFDRPDIFSSNSSLASKKCYHSLLTEKKLETRYCIMCSYINDPRNQNELFCKTLLRAFGQDAFVSLKEEKPRSDPGSTLCFKK